MSLQPEIDEPPPMRGAEAEKTKAIVEEEG